MFVLRFLLLTRLISFLPAESITLTAERRPSSSSPAIYSQTITLNPGDLATTPYLSSSAYLDVTTNNLTIRLAANQPDQANLPVIAGPATIRLTSVSTTSHSLATITIKRAGETATVPTQTVVIPDDGSGDREVQLESSTDMVNWTTTQPGLFTTTNAARFFRVRVTKVPEP